MNKKELRIDNVPAVLYGEDADKVWLFVHGKCGCKEEGEAFAALACPCGWQVLAIDLPDHGSRQGSGGFDPMHAVPEMRTVMEYLQKNWQRISLRANSIGAFFSMLAFSGTPLEKALFVSPITDMEKLIGNMMLWAGVDEQRLEREKEIATAFGETLYWDYFQYVKAHPIEKWDAPTSVLYGGMDNLTDRATVDSFCARFGCALTVMEDGEHWFHTPPQLKVLTEWESSLIDRQLSAV